MPPRKQTKPKKYILKPDSHLLAHNVELVGIQTTQKLYKLVFDFNKIFGFDFYLNEDLILERRHKTIAFQNYITPENNIGQKMRLLQNEVLIPVSHPNTLFDTDEAFYLFPDLPSLNYLLMLYKDEDIGYQFIQQNFKVPYTCRFIEIDVHKCATVFPVFPV